MKVKYELVMRTRSKGRTVAVTAIQKDFGGCAKNLVESTLVRMRGRVLRKIFKFYLVESTVDL